jgi:hypothetical protein
MGILNSLKDTVLPIGILDSLKGTVSALTSSIGEKFNNFDIIFSDSRINSVLALYSKGSTELINPKVEVKDSELFLYFETMQVFLVSVKLKLDIKAVINADKKIISCSMIGWPVIRTKGYLKNKLVAAYTVITSRIFRINPVMSKLKTMNLGGVSIAGNSIQIDLDDAAVDAALGNYRHVKQFLNVVSIESVQCKDENIVVTMTAFPKKSQAVNF